MAVSKYETAVCSSNFGLTGEIDAKNFFVKKFSALSKNFRK